MAKVFVLHPEGQVPSGLFKDMEKTHDVKYVPVDKKGCVLESFTMHIGDTLYICGERVFNKPFTIIEGGDKS